MIEEKKLAELRKRLEDEREQLSAESEITSIENTNQDDDFGASNHVADDATDVFLRERNMALNNNSSDLIAQIDAALERMDNGTYGTCARCGQPIGIERLEALPYVAYCITCQAEVEREGGV